MNHLKHWQDAVSAAIAVWPFTSPWVPGSAGQGGAAGHATAVTSTMVIGLALIAAALGAIFIPSAWEEWTELGLGIWLIASPWALAYEDLPGATISAVGCGIVVAALALWTLLTDDDYLGWLRKEPAAH